MLPINSFALRQLTALATNAKSFARPDFTIDSFPEYATSPETLAPDQRRILAAGAAAIVHSQTTNAPVVAAVIVGHADRALRKPVGERAAFELEVSQKRANAAAGSLLRELVVRSHGAHYAKCFRYVAVGIGNTLPRHVHAANEQQMRQNRRVEITLLSCALGQPYCGTT
jgi:outer membrane protein OmpA-like peptidoglycan-associated protein